MMKRWFEVLAAVAVVVTSVSACSGAERAGPTDLTRVDPDMVYVEGVPTLNEVMKGSSGKPPSSGPAAVPGKRVWFISCGQTLRSCAMLGDAVEEAADILGWKLQIGDGKLNPTGYADAMDAAIAQRPDAIIVGSIGCPSIQQSIDNARRAGIVVLGIKSPDCDEPPMNSKPSFTEPMYYVGTNNKGYTAASVHRAKAAADYLINVTQGNAKVIFEKGNDPAIEPGNQAFLEELERCSGCEVVKTVEYVPTDQGPDGALAQGLQAALVQHPEANALYAPYDANLILSRGAQIAKQSRADITIIGADGTPDGLDLVRNGDVAVETGAHSFDWYAFAAMDSVNRIFAGEPVIDQGLGYQPVDRDHNLPDTPGSTVQAPFDVAATYARIWKG